METKYCKKCDRNLPKGEFANNKSKSDGLQAQCRECKKATDAKHYEANKDKQLERNRKNRARNRELLREYKSKLGCKYCNEFDECCLDFHHHSDDKEFTIAKKGADYSWENLLKEVKKCQVVCASCHRKIHAGRKLKARQMES